MNEAMQKCITAFNALKGTTLTESDGELFLMLLREAKPKVYFGGSPTFTGKLTYPKTVTFEEVNKIQVATTIYPTAEQTQQLIEKEKRSENLTDRQREELDKKYNPIYAKERSHEALK